MTGPDPDGPTPGTEPTPPPEGPPGGGIFTLEGRRAPGLYLAAWVITVFGLVISFLIGPMASDPTASNVLLIVGSFVTALGFATACGYQVLERRVREPEAYRGPAPLLVFGAYFFGMSLLGLIVTGAGWLDLEDPFGFLVLGALQTVGYILAVWMLVVRSGALGWPQMGWPTWNGGAVREVLRSIGYAVAVTLPLTFGLLVLAGLLATLLGVTAPDVLPDSETSAQALAVALAAAFIVPIGEELFFRGFVLTAWLRDLGERTALIRTSVLFALIHIANIRVDETAEGWAPFIEGLSQALLLVVVILPLAFVLGWLFLRRGLVASIAGHITYNGTLLLLAALATNVIEST